ncbi:MAG: hypothetical protein HN341_16490, partial [Verrucomicrobia bacterium]|nr:hypothetical protein [Verrucomicrobiota bacterium]
FETLPTERTGDGHRITEIHRYRCRARALTAGTIRLAPNLKLIALRRRRMLIGSAWEETPVQVSIAPLHLAVKPLPTPPAGFSGAIGSFAMSAAIDPADIVQGDLVTLTTRISGRGFTDGMQQPGIRATPQFKVYDPKRVHASPDLLVFEQVIIPQSAEVSAIPEVGLTYFDTNAGTYKHLKGGPFPIAFHDATAETLEHFRPTDAGAAPSQSQPDAPEPPGLLDRLRRLLGHARYEQAVCSATTEAHMAPSSTSFSSFELQPGTEVSILRQHAEWLLIESEAQRGWIPRAAVNP